MRRHWWISCLILLFSASQGLKSITEIWLRHNAFNSLFNQHSFWNDANRTSSTLGATALPLGKKVKGRVLNHEVTFLSARPLLFHPCLTLLLSLSRMLSWAAGRASGVYLSYCMTYTWRVCSLFIFRSPTAWAQLSAVCTISATVSFVTFSSPGSHTYSRCIHSDLGASGSTGKVERTDKAGPFVSLPLTACNFYLCKWISYDMNSFVFFLKLDRLLMTFQSQTLSFYLFIYIFQLTHM